MARAPSDRSRGSRRPEIFFAVFLLARMDELAIVGALEAFARGRVDEAHVVDVLREWGPTLPPGTAGRLLDTMGAMCRESPRVARLVYRPQVSGVVYEAWVDREG